MTPRLHSALPILLLALLPATPSMGDDVLTAEMVVDLSRVGAVSLSPDGNAVAYTRSVPRDAKDEHGAAYSELWLAGLDGGDPRRFAGRDENVGAPSWSPDGRWISFLVEREAERKGTQIWAIPVDGGEAKPLTHHDGSVASYAWSPDGRRIAYAATDADSEDEKETKEAGKDWQVYSEAPSFRHLRILDVESGESRRLFAGDLDAREIHWTPDGSQILFQATSTARIDDEYLFSSIYCVEADGDDAEPAVVVPTEGKLGPMAISPDGRHLAYLGATSLNDPLAQSLFVAALSGGGARNLTVDYIGSAANIAWRDDATILMLAVEGERHALHDVDLTTGDRASVPWSGLTVGAMDLDRASGTLAVAGAAHAHPAELFVVDPGESPRRLTHHSAALEGVRLARQKTIQWPSVDGTTIGGVLTYPLDYEEGRRYPLVLQVHGGPEGVSLDGWTTSAGYPVQLLAAAGYMVLEPNYRGSQGRGVAFSKADHDDLGGTEFEDILAGIDWLVELGFVDPERVGTGGWSYGGYMSAWAATRHSERFRASVVAAGLTNWISFAGSTDIPYEMSIVHWNSWWFDEPELHWERSPIAHLDKANTPTLVVTGAKDERVHPEQAMELHTALRIKDVPTELVFYPREPHGLRERAHQLDFIERTIGWFDHHLSLPEVEEMEPRRD